MKIKKIFKYIIGIPLACLAILSLFLIEEGSLGVFSFALSCDSKIDYEQFRVCVENIPGNYEVVPSERGWIASVELGVRILPGIYRRIGGWGENKFIFESHVGAQLQVRMPVPPIVEVLIDSKEVAKFKVPKDFVDQ